MKRVFVIGNGESRKGFDLEKLRPHGKIYGCNALYRDFTPDVITAVDMGIMHEVYNSGYAQNNQCVFRDWNKMPGEMYEQLLYAGQNYSDQDYDLIKKENVITSNERGDSKEFVMHGSNLAGVVEILKKNKDREKKEVNHTSINVSWVTSDDKVRAVNDYMINPGEIDSPYMNMAFHSTDLAQKDLIATIHPYDHTLRPQILSRSQNPRYYDLIKQFEAKTGIGGILNTSFNLHGDPIVCTPEQAINTLRNSGLEYLSIGDYLISKS